MLQRLDLVAGPLQQGDEGPADLLVVVDDKNAHAAGPWAVASSIGARPADLIVVPRLADHGPAAGATRDLSVAGSGISSSALYTIGREGRMTPTVLLEHLVALYAEHSDAHQRMLAALQANDLIGLVEASMRQGALCSEQGALLGEYVAAALAAMPDIDATDRERVTQLARELRAPHRDPQAKAAGG
jgi:hypothetical protein